MNPLPQIVITFCCALFVQASSYGIDSPTDPFEINGIITWTEPDCQGVAASTIFNGSTMFKNMTNACLSRSFKLLRPLQGQEQLDISIAQEPDLRHSYDHQSFMNDLSCTSFIQSYFPVNETEGCRNTPPFTCHRLWVNYGLSPVLRGPKPSKSWMLPSPLPTILPYTCFRPSSALNLASLINSSSCFSPSLRGPIGSVGTEQSPLLSITSRQPKQLPSSPVVTTTTHLRSSFTPSVMRTSSTSAIYIPSYESASKIVTTRTLSSHIAATSSRSFTHMVRVEPGESLEFAPGNMLKFVPRTLDVSVGNTVWFYSLNGSFLLYNTTLEKPCGRLVRYGDDAYKHVIFQVNSTEPLWLIGSQEQDVYSCCPSSYFALNPGAQKDQFFHSIEEYCSIVVVSTSTLPDMHTPTTGTIVVKPNGDVVTTLGISVR